jgi:hypothetical protein
MDPEAHRFAGAKHSTMTLKKRPCFREIAGRPGHREWIECSDIITCFRRYYPAKHLPVRRVFNRPSCVFQGLQPYREPAIWRGFDGDSTKAFPGFFCTSESGEFLIENANHTRTSKGRKQPKWS